jgi:hypothetical protein
MSTGSSKNVEDSNKPFIEEIVHQVSNLPELYHLVCTYGSINTEVHVKIFSSTFAELSVRLYVFAAELHRSCLQMSSMNMNTNTSIAGLPKRLP